MNKLKLFIENFLVYGLGGIISRIIPLIMVPIVTRLMPETEYFGISDMSNTVVQFASALAVMGMYDAMYRMFFEKDDLDFKRSVCSTALLFSIGTSIVVFVIVILFKDMIAKYFFGNEQYAYLVYISAMAALVGATNSIVSAPTRMQNKRKIFLITNTLSPVIAYAISIPLLLKGHYIIALPLAAAISGITMELAFVILNHKWFRFQTFDFGLLKELLKIAIPLLPNFLIYWIFNSSDKLMITNIIGIGAAGIYSVGSKLGHVSQLIYTAFAGGWQYFAFSTMKEDDQVSSNSSVFEYLGVISFVAGIFMCAWCRPIFNLLFEGEYQLGYTVVPYLFLAPLMQMLYQVAANQFLVIKKTWPNMLILLCGAVANVILNWILIPRLGIEGAAVATLMGYLIADLIAILVLRRIKLMIIRGRFCIVALITLAFFVLWRLFFREHVLISSFMAMLAMIFFSFTYLKDLKVLLNAFVSKKRVTV